MKKGLTIVLCLVLVFSFAACAQKEKATIAEIKVGVSMPTTSLQRWNQDGDNIKKQLEEAGYTVDLQYAGDNEIPLQIQQIEDMIADGCKILIVAAIDANQLSGPMTAAKEAGIPVISYDRLIMGTNAVSYYATFDNTKVGNLQGQAIVDALDLENQAGPFHIELFTGDLADNNVNFFFGGAMDVLQPYIDSGVLVVPSEQTTTALCATENWNTEKSQERMEALIASQGYGPNGKKLDAILSSNDSVANGITNALVAAGYTEKNFPVLTGQDCDITSVKNMIAGTQTMSVFKDTRILAEQTVKMVKAILEGEEVPVNDTTTYNNGTGIIPTFLCEPVPGNASNYKELLIESGYYTEEQLG
ncbi:MAG: sugar-binding protein [Clostridiales Family XIII bacterium]|jgi:putative multiple sugar transport system substrate-binding protein|nr:sugar-binding protein [Clostridiales Family XIII bacterium]